MPLLSHLPFYHNRYARITKILLPIIMTMAFALPAHFAIADGMEHNAGSVGATYPIVEPNALEELKSKAESVDWSKYLSKKQYLDEIRNYKPAGIASLPRARHDNRFNVKPVYTLDHDIQDGHGGIIYPAGFQYNPLTSVTLHSTLVIINGADKKQLGWFRKSEYADKLQTKLLLTGGAWYDLAGELHRPVYYLTQMMADRLGVKSVPSVVTQSGDKFVIHEIDVEVEK